MTNNMGNNMPISYVGIFMDAFMPIIRMGNIMPIKLMAVKMPILDKGYNYGYFKVWA